MNERIPALRGKNHHARCEALCCALMSARATSDLPPFLAEMAAIALGGAIGACLRFAVALGIGATHLHGALAASIVNIAGSFLLGLVVGHLESGRAHPLLRPFLTVGVFGSFTTFSAVALDNRMLASEAGEGIAIAHLAASVVLGLAAFALGNTADAFIEAPRGEEPR
jgi:CrcB protein